MKDGVRLGDGYTRTGGGSRLKRKYEPWGTLGPLQQVPVNDFFLVRQGRDTGPYSLASKAFVTDLT